MPYLPDYPELPAAFQGQTMSLALALSRGANLILMGNPGSGKTIALAHLASQVARKAATIGEVGNLLPVFVQCDELLPTSEFEGDAFAAILQALADRPSKSDHQLVTDFLRQSLERGQALFLLDGLDCASPEQYAACLRFLEAFRKQSPRARAVVAASTGNIAGLTALGFIPVAMASWDAPARSEFIHQWGMRWRQYVPIDARPEKEPVAQELLDAWLSSAGEALTPLELTLKL